MYPLDKFYVQESDRVLRLYWVSFLNEKGSLRDPLMILGFDSVSSEYGGGAGGVSGGGEGEGVVESPKI